MGREAAWRSLISSPQDQKCVSPTPLFHVDNRIVRGKKNVFGGRGEIRQNKRGEERKVSKVKDGGVFLRGMLMDGECETQSC